MADTTITLRPKVVHLELYRGDDFGPWEITWEQPAGSPVDISGYSIKAQVREDVDSADTLAEFDVVITDGPAGKFTIALSDTDTAALPASAKWDLQLTSPAGVTRTFMAGKVKTMSDVSRPNA